MRIVLILAASPEDPLRRRDPIAPLSLPLLAACAPQHDYRIVDMLWDDTVPYDTPVDLVGISVRLHAQETAFSVAKQFREKGAKVILGGPQISAIPHEAINHADAVVVGEGEPLWARIVDDAEKNSLRSFYVCSPHPFDSRGGSVYQHNRHADLNEIPIANRKLLRRRYTFDSLFAVRGCPVRCDFCSVGDLFGTTYRTRPIQTVIEEINTLGTYFYLLDDTVFGRKQLYSYYLALYTEMIKLKKKRYWIGQANLDAAASPQGRAVIKKASQAGLMYAAVGIESVNLDTLQSSGALNKSGSDSSDYIRKMKRHIRFFYQQGIFVSGWFVIGYETDTAKTWGECLEFARQTAIFPVIFPVKALPGTRLFKRALSEGTLIEDSYRVAHPLLDDQTVYREMMRVKRKGHSLLSICINCLRFAFLCPKDRIRRTIFAFITQMKLRKGIDIMNKSFWRA